jgi:hypothetical protein
MEVIGFFLATSMKLIYNSEVLFEGLTTMEARW